MQEIDWNYSITFLGLWIVFVSVILNKYSLWIPFKTESKYYPSFGIPNYHHHWELCNFNFRSESNTSWMCMTNEKTCWMFWQLNQQTGTLDVGQFLFVSTSAMSIIGFVTESILLIHGIFLLLLEYLDLFVCKLT